MFEGYTYETLLGRMLDRLPPTLDRREGSFLYAALAPAAWELSEAYANLERALLDGFAATATRESLILLGRERGLAPNPASCALLTVRFPTDGIGVGERFSTAGIGFTVESRKEDCVFTLRAESAGESGNLPLGKTAFYSEERGSIVAEVVALTSPGLPEEDTESFRARYFDSLSAQSFGGNRADYAERMRSLAGVGSVKIIPAWNGEGTVKVIFTDSEGNEPSEELVVQVQNAVDGFAPIGHTVTVVPAVPVVMDVTAALTYEEGADVDAVQTAVMDALVDRFDLLAQEWHDREASVVRYAKLYACVLDCAGVAGVTDLAVGGARETLTLAPDEIPILGDILLA